MFVDFIIIVIDGPFFVVVAVESGKKKEQIIDGWMDGHPAYKKQIYDLSNGYPLLLREVYFFFG